MKPTMTLAELETECRRRADLPTTGGPVTSAEWAGYINGSILELYDRLVAAYGEDYYAKTYTFTTDGTSDEYDLPVDNYHEQKVYKVVGLDVAWTAAPNGWASLTRYAGPERNQFGGLGIGNVRGWGPTMRYRERANKVSIIPRAQAGQSMRLLYVPRLYPLGAPITITAPDGAAAATTFSILSYNPRVPSAGGDSWVISFPTYGTDFSELAEQLNDSFFNEDSTEADLGLVATQVSNTEVSITLRQGYPPILFWKLESNTTIAFDAPETLASVESQFLSPGSFDGFGGWLDYVVVDAVIKAKSKQQKDTAELERAKLRLGERIDRMSASRNVGEVAHSVDVNARGSWPFGSGWEP